MSEAEAPKPEVPAEPTTPAEPAKEPEKKPEPLSPKLAQIARAEAKARAEREAIKAEREALAKEKAALEARSKLKAEDIDEWLKAEGLSYEEITNLKLSGKKKPEPKPEEPLHPKVLELQAQLDAMKEAEKKRAEAESAQQAEAYQKQTFAAIKSAGEKYELINAAGEVGLNRVWAVICEHARENGAVLPFEKAAEQVEAEIEAELEGLKPVLSTKKGSARLLPASEKSSDPKSAVPQAASESGPSSAARTLSHSLAGAAPTTAKPRDLTYAERVALAKRNAAGRG